MEAARSDQERDQLRDLLGAATAADWNAAQRLHEALPSGFLVDLTCLASRSMRREAAALSMKPAATVLTPVVVA